jgi:hypothetical protein
MAEDVEVTIGASTEDLTGAIGEAREGIIALLRPLQEMKASFGEVAEAAATAFAIEKIHSFYEELTRQATELQRNSAMLGTTADQTAVLGLAAQATGGSTEGLSAAMARLQLGLARGAAGSEQIAAALKTFHLNARELISLPITEQIDKLADSISRFKDSPEKSAAGVALLGRGFRELLPILNQGSAGMRELREMSVRSGDAIIGQTQPAFLALHHQLLEMNETFANSSRIIGASFAPAFSTVVTVLTAVAQSFVNAEAKSHDFRTSMEKLAEIFKAFVTAGVAIVGICKDIAAALTLLQDHMDIAGRGLGDFLKNALTFGALGGKVDVTKELAEADKKFNDQIKTNAEEANALIVAINKKGAEEVTKTKQDQTAHFALEDKKAMAEAAKEAEEQIRIAELTFNQVKEKLDAQVKVHAITQKQETTQLLAALDQRTAAELGAESKVQAIYGKGTEQYKIAEDKKTEILLKAATERQKIMDKQTEADVKSWTDALDKIQNAWDSQLKGLLAGTTTWSQAMKNIFADLILDIIKGFEKIIIEKAALGLASSAGGLGSILGSIGTALAAGAVVGLQEGAWNVPSQTLALLHPGEMVMPAGPAQQFRDNAAVGPAGGASISMNLSAIDSTGLQAMINRITPQIARSLQSYQALNPSAQ